MSLLSDDHVYSYTQFSAFDECPFSFYLNYIDKAEKKSNAFSEQGTLVHDLIDKWAKGEIPIDQLPAEYERRYPQEVVTQFPRLLAAKGYAEKSFEQGLAYFETFNGFDGYQIVETESRFKTDIGGKPFIGIIDMVLRDELTDELVLLDHKSKSLASFKKAERAMYRQQYLYSKHIYETYGCWPDRLAFNLFKENGIIKCQPFDMEEYDNTIAWATDIIRQIESFDVIDWMCSKEKSDFFCQNLCSVRGRCPNGR